MKKGGADVPARLVTVMACWKGYRSSPALILPITLRKAGCNSKGTTVTSRER